MALTAAGKWGPDSFIDRSGRPVVPSLVTVPTGYTATVDGLGNVTITGPPSDGIAVSVTAPDGTVTSYTLPVSAATAELGQIEDRMDVVEADLRLDVVGLPMQRKIVRGLARIEGRDVQPVNIFHVGDSLGEGYNASSVAKRAQHVLYKNLLSAYPTLGVNPQQDVPHYLPVYYQTGISQPSYGAVLSGSPTRNDTVPSLGNRSVALAVGQTVTWTGVTARKIDLHYPRGAAGTHASVKVTVTPVGGSAVVNTYAGTSSDGVSTLGQVRILDATVDQVVDVLVEHGGGSGDAYVAGLIRYSGGDDALGIRSYDLSHGGFGAVDFADATKSLGLYHASRLLRPHITFIELGVNDFSRARTVAQFKADVETIIANLRDGAAAAGPATPVTDGVFVLEGMFEVTQYAAGAPSPWADYLDALQEIADADDQVIFLDLSRLFPPNTGTADPTTEGAKSGLYFADGTHLTTGGQMLWGEFKARVLTLFPNYPQVDDTPWQMPIDPTQPRKASVGTWTLAASSALGPYIANGVGAQNDYLEYDVLLPAGTWVFTLSGQAGTSRGIVTVKLDDGAGTFTDLGAVDFYAASTVNYHTGATAAFAVNQPIRRTLRLITATTNASSTGYGTYLTAVASGFRRTA